MKKVIGLVVAALFLCTPAFAGDQPEYDTVACDATNFFNGFVKKIVCEENLYAGVERINEHSDWTPIDAGEREFFQSNGGQPKPDMCFNWPARGLLYNSRLAEAFNNRWFRWQIVLQKKPQTDLNVNIVDCVTKPNATTVFGSAPFDGAEQTGRYSGFLSPGTFWLVTANPRITVTAVPGPLADPAFATSGAFTLNARVMPGLGSVPLKGALYTSKALWEEGLVVEMPLDGGTDVDLKPTYRLFEGDALNIYVAVPGESTASIRYGRDNVSVKYIAIHGTEYKAETQCGGCQLTSF
jgi:hypothetical protein